MHAFVEILLLNVGMTVDMNDANILTSDGRKTTDGRESNGMVAAKNNGHSALRSNVGHGIGYLIETLLNIGRNSEDVANVAESLKWGDGKYGMNSNEMRAYDELRFSSKCMKNTR